MLRISNNLQLPLDAVTQTFAILAMRGVGKTYTATVMVEEMLKSGLHVVIVDPVGVWWGLRSSADGEGPGLNVIIAGGDHGDIPIEATAGTLMAELVVNEGVSLILDISDMTIADQVRFMTDFSLRLYQINRDPLHVVIDEADEFCPQSPTPDKTRIMGAIDRIVRRGRAKGLGVTLISQRPAVVNKNVLTQISTLVTLRIISPQDRAAIKTWVGAYGTAGQGDELVKSLAQLDIGEAWFWSPAWLDVFSRVKVRTRETFDSSATPKVGDVKREPKMLADVNLEAIRVRMADLIEHASEDDPKALKKQIQELHRRLESRQVERVEVPVITDENAELLKSVVESVRESVGELSLFIEHFDRRCAGVKPIDRKSILTESLVQDAANAEVDADITKPQRKILFTLSRFAGMGLYKVARHNLAVLAGVKPKSSGYANNLSRLNVLGLICYPEQGYVRLTDSGWDITGRDIPTMSAQRLHEAWYEALPRPQAAILEQLIHQYPDSYSRVALAGIVGVSAASSGYANNLSALHSLGLIEYPERGHVAAAKMLFPGEVR